jgi:hypothetical protein
VPSSLQSTGRDTGYVLPYVWYRRYLHTSMKTLPCSYIRGNTKTRR